MERHPNPPRVERRNDDESTTQTSRTEDDPVRDAVRAALAAGAIEDDDDDDDQIVWAPKSVAIFFLKEAISNGLFLKAARIASTHPCRRDGSSRAVHSCTVLVG